MKRTIQTYPSQAIRTDHENFFRHFLLQRRNIREQTESTPYMRSARVTKKYVSFSVGVGTFTDPKELPAGLISLQGSMILLGSSEEYPADLKATQLPRLGIVDSILTQLRNIDSWFKRQRRFRFFDSSILFTYDAQNLATLYEENESELINEELTHCRGDVPVKVRMIDFGKVVPDTDDEEDKNYLKGLQNLIYIFKHLRDLYSGKMPVDVKKHTPP